MNANDYENKIVFKSLISNKPDINFDDEFLSFDYSFSETVKEKVREFVHEDIESINLLKKADNEWQQLESFDKISRYELGYYTVAIFRKQLWKEVKTLEYDLIIQQNTMTKKNSVMMRGGLQKILQLMFNLEIWKASDCVASVKQIWCYDTDKFFIEFNAETDLRGFIRSENCGLSQCTVRYYTHRIVKWWEYLSRCDLRRYFPYYDYFVVGIDDALNVIPGFVYCERRHSSSQPLDIQFCGDSSSGETESQFVQHCGETILRLFSDEEHPRIDHLGVEPLLSGFPDDVADIVRLCVGSEVDRPTFSSLLASPSLTMTCQINLYNLMEINQKIQDQAKFSLTGLTSKVVLDIVRRKYDTDVHNVAVIWREKIVNGLISCTYQPSFDLAFLIVESVPASYREIGRLGSGSFGSVYSYVDSDSNTCAMKRLFIGNNKCESVRSFVQENDIYKRLNHERIITYFGCYQHKWEYMYLKMELMTTSLGNEVRENQLPLDDIRRYTRQIAEGLQYLHGNNVIHRDVKCDNVLLKGKNIKLTDFGLSKLLSESQMNNPRPQSCVGTFASMAPEMMLDEPYNYKIDIWSLGATVWEMATGRYCFSGHTYFQTLLHITTRRTLEQNKDIPGTIQSFIELCTVQEPEERPSSTDLLNDRFLSLAE